MSTTSNRLEAIEQELKSILEDRVNELMSSMRQTETLTRRIIVAETEITQSRQVREDLEAENDRIRGDITAMRARVDEIRSTNGDLVTERDKLRKELESAEAEANAMQQETDSVRSRIAELSTQRDALQSETADMQMKVQNLEEMVDRMRELREQLRTSIGSLSSELGSSGS